MIHRITANTGWARRSSAKAQYSLQQRGESAPDRRGRSPPVFALHVVTAIGVLSAFAAETC